MIVGIALFQIVFWKRALHEHQLFIQLPLTMSYKNVLQFSSILDTYQKAILDHLYKS